MNKTIGVVCAWPVLVIALGLAAGQLHAEPEDYSSSIRSSAKQKNPVVEQSNRITPRDLDRMINAYADRYVSAIASATIEVSSDNPSNEQRRLAHLMKLASSTSVYDIATNADPFSNLVDMMAMVTLQSRSWVEEGNARKSFGKRAPPLITAFTSVREDIRELAKKVLQPGQQQRVEQLILDWRQRNPEVNITSFFRFNDIVGIESQEVLAEIRRASGMFGIAEATHAVEEARLLAERAFYQSKRMPFLISWQMEALLDESLAKPQVEQSLQSVDSLAHSAERASLSLEKLPTQISAERAAILQALQDQSGEISRLLGELRVVSESGERVTANLHETMIEVNKATRTVDAILARQPQQPPSSEPARPFEIESYTRIVEQVNQTVVGLNTALLNADALVNKRIAAISDVQGAVAEVIDHGFWRAFLLLAAFFAMLLAYRLITLRYASNRVGPV